MTEAVVVGGGLAGLAAAVAVARAGLETLHLAPKAPPDRRTSALMMPTVRYLQGAGLIGAPATLGHPLTAIRIIDATTRLLRAPETLFEATEAELEAFGWNFPNSALLRAFSEAGAGLPNLTTRETAVRALSRAEDGNWRLRLADGGEVTATLLVGADGKRSPVRETVGIGVREHAFAEAALVCDVTLGRPIGGTSVEFHYPRGPFTLVPAGGERANLVWIDARPVLDGIKAGGEERLTAALAEKSQRLFGAIAPASPAFVFPLSTLRVDVAGRDGVVLVGEAAHAFPPIGAQGLNLGLRDVADLAAELSDTSRSVAGWADRLSERYARRRAADLSLTGGMVDGLFRSLLSDMLPAQAVRTAGLWALRTLPGLRRQAFAIGMGQR